MLIAFLKSLLIIFVLIAISPHLTLITTMILGIFIIETIIISKIIKKLAVTTVEKTRARQLMLMKVYRELKLLSY